jgi:hypothetical protein
MTKVSILKHLIKDGANISNRVNGVSALGLAVRRGKLATVRLLLRAYTPQDLVNNVSVILGVRSQYSSVDSCIDMRLAYVAATQALVRTRTNAILWRIAKNTRIRGGIRADLSTLDFRDVDPLIRGQYEFWAMYYEMLEKAQYVRPTFLVPDTGSQFPQGVSSPIDPIAGPTQHIQRLSKSDFTNVLRDPDGYAAESLGKSVLEDVHEKLDRTFGGRTANDPTSLHRRSVKHSVGKQAGLNLFGRGIDENYFYVTEEFEVIERIELE